MYKIAAAFLVTVLFANSLWACGGGNQLQSISPDLNGVTQLKFLIDNFGQSESVTVEDNDGMATTAFLYFALIQDVSDGIWQQKIDWEKIKNKPVAGWNLVGKRIVESLNKVTQRYKEWSVKEPGLIEYYNQVSPIIPTLQKTPTYAVLSDSLGKVLTNLAEHHSYPVQVDTKKHDYHLVENNSGNPVGILLASHPFTLPPQYMSRCGSPLSVDLRSVLK